MARIMAIDFGTKRIGLAVTDPLQIIATALETVDNYKIWEYLTAYFAKENVVKVLIGMPLREDGSDTDSTPYVRVFVEDFSKKFPALTVELRDEAYTSKLAMQAMVQAGVKKKQRREKGNLDKLSATIILQEYLG